MSGAKMVKSTSKNGCLTLRRQCPCGDEQCYIRVEEDEEEACYVEIFGDVNVLQETSHTYLQRRLQAPSDNASLDAPPFIGQSFRTDDEAQDYYISFARQNGFSIRRERSKGNLAHPMGVYKRELVCHRAGISMPRKSTQTKRHRNKKSTRCGCKAQMVIKKNTQNGMADWVVVNFSNEHNHELLDSKEVRHLPAYRSISLADRERILELAKSGCAVNLIMKALEMQKGVKPGDLSFTERDLRNFLQSSKNMNQENEGSELLKACKSMKEKHPGFRYEFVLAENNRLLQIVWSYPESVHAFSLFGDVVIFDTTYSFYAYDRPLGVWFGFDNFGRTIFFGCVLLQDDKPHSYRWALQSFVHLMDGKVPQTMVTDIDMGLKDAILSELPNTKHIFCVWHITSKLPSWFSVPLGSQYEKFVFEFNRIYNLENIVDFEQQWTQIILEFGLGSDRHMAILSFHQDYWALPFLRGFFLGGLLRTGFSISVKSFFKGFLSSQTQLKDFIEQVAIAVDFQNQVGEEEAIRQNYQNVKIKTCMPIEEHASAVLTNYAFEMLQREIVLSTQFAVYESGGDGYLVRHRLDTDGGFLVRCIPSDGGIHCSCKEFESSGILCSHALRVLSINNCFSIPDRYLLVRWRRESSLFPQSSGYKYRSQALRSLASIVIQESLLTKTRFNYVQWNMSKLLAHLREMPTTDGGGSDLEPSSSLDVTLDANFVDMGPSRRRGRPKKIEEPVEAAKRMENSY